MQIHLLAVTFIALALASYEVLGIKLSEVYVNYGRDYRCGEASLNHLSGNKTPSNKSAPYIVNGNKVKHGDWPSLVLVKIAGLQCSGVIIRPDVVLTAGHCLNRVVPFRYSDRREFEEGMEGNVTVGMSTRDSKKQSFVVHQVSAVQKGGFYRERNISQVEADLGRVFLREPIKFTRYVQPACVPSTAAAVDRLLVTKNFKHTYVVGFGAHSRINKTDFNVSRTARVLQVKKVACVERQRFETDICFAPIDGKNSGICQGDSGGPVLVLDQNKRWSVVALATGAYNCNATGRTPVAGLDRYLKLSKVVEILKKDHVRFSDKQSLDSKDLPRSDQ